MTVNIKFVTCELLLFFTALLSEILCLYGVTVSTDNWDLDYKELSGREQTNGCCLEFIFKWIVVQLESVDAL